MNEKLLIILFTSLFLCSCEIVAPLAAISVPTYLNYVRKARGAEAEIYIDTIYKQAGIYFTEEGLVPTTLDEMRALNLLSLEPKAELSWTFDLSQLEAPDAEQESSAGLGGKITAESTEEMGGGPGETVEFDAATGTYCGYGHQECSQ